VATDGSIFGAADRMLTRGVTQTEPPIAKIYHFEHPLPVTLMWAGNSSVFGEVLQDCTTMAVAHPDKYKSIQSYVDLWCNQFGGYIGKRAERAILTRLGLTRKDIVSSKVSYDHAKRLGQQIIDYCLFGEESVEVIITGHDADGAAHIWTIHDSTPWNRDVEGFAAIGMGADHAYSQLQFAAYSRQATAPEALIMTYLAKRRAEIAPGVGKTTDLFARESGKAWWPVPDGWVAAFGTEYEKFAQAERDALSTAVRSVAKAMFDIMAAANVQTTQPAPLADASPVAEQQSPPTSTHDQ